MAVATDVDFERHPARLALGIGFVAQNTTVALTFGLYGVFVQFFAESFQLDRTMASMGLPIVILTMGLTNPWMGWLIGRFSIRRLMLAGAWVMSAGFGLAAFAPSARLVLASFIPIGLGYAMLGTLPATALVANWYERTRGRAIGFVNIPLGSVLMPPLATALFITFGWRATFGAFSLLLLALVPLLSRVRDRPEEVGSRVRHEPVVTGSGPSGTGGGSVLRSPFFWMATLAAGMILASGSARTVHVVPYATSMGIDATHAALLMSLSASAAIPGAILFGVMSDRYGGSAALALNGVVQVFGWALLLVAGPRFLLLACAIALLGACSGGVYVALSTVFSIRYGTKILGATLGYASALKLPFTFSAPIVIAWLFDMRGDYRFAFSGVLILVAGCATIFAVLAILQRCEQMKLNTPFIGKEST